MHFTRALLGAGALPSASVGNAVGLAPTSLPAAATEASERAAWRRLRGGAGRGGVLNCSLGFCALGMPHGTALAALADRKFAPRSVLGSAQPIKLDRRVLEAAEASRALRLARAKTDKIRRERLGQMRASGAIPNQDTGMFFTDFQGTRRGRCESCMGCSSGFVQPLWPTMGTGHPMMMYCLCCGCAAWEHTDEDKAREVRNGKRSETGG